MKAYTLIEHGFSISLDMRLFEREAVMKALYRFHDRFMISYEIRGERLQIDFEENAPSENYDDTVSAIMKELDFQMIRMDTIRRTGDIRKLLVARALYATCIEPERDHPSEYDDDISDWHEDQKRIFSSWSSEL